MAVPKAARNWTLIDAAMTRGRRGWAVLRDQGPGQVQFWFLALLIGVGSGFAALFFRLGIDLLQSALYRVEDVTRLASATRDLPWYLFILWPTLGGLAVGLLLFKLSPDGRVRAVADVIEGAALRDGRVETKVGLASALASLITLGSGGSSGREGPVVHLAAVMATWVNDLIRARGITARDLLGCAVAAAVSASFNAPIAGALFALEVVLRHFAVHAFAPIVIASAIGTVINRMEFGGVTEFDLNQQSPLEFYVELPAFLLLGLVCGAVAVILMRAVFWTDDRGEAIRARLGVAPWIRPAVAGAMLGCIAIFFPQIIGVGYETTSLALTGELLMREAIVIAIVKVAAVAITMGGRMGGGIFSPSLMVGSLVGLSFGLIATAVFPAVSGSATLYALAGMGAVAAAVLGAPISTTLIVFELTGDWQTGLAVMVAVSTSTALASRFVDRSFFLTQLERRGVHLSKGPQAYLLCMFRVINVMRPSDHARAIPTDDVWEALESGVYIEPNATLEKAMPMFEETARMWLPVVRIGGEGEAPQILGTLHHVDALARYNKALAATAAEEHS
ncbi:chloride channel protein, CIC family [Palleronia marisminoris]|uniref:H(+)/Cl(-) exchange transporter ClcA n=1 Tax=Palleronia marisminoris TaxID=315423 RepID=A0A1Y5RR80_9RHOB|nr:chloride channel protein [Palleronia marisminoris]SFG54464.1 chloride channel protein, CIC family [Palleronia marisminoris]SLN23042.1 H(+)/Cl(-) exchange transporter ClcA [Palleronia marisminoris]